jgi:hypothetical protein
MIACGRSGEVQISATILGNIVAITVRYCYFVRVIPVAGDTVLDEK